MPRGESSVHCAECCLAVFGQLGPLRLGLCFKRKVRHVTTKKYNHSLKAHKTLDNRESSETMLRSRRPPLLRMLDG